MIPEKKSLPSGSPAASSFLLVVAPQEAGWRLDHFLASKLAARELTRSRLQGLIRAGTVSVETGPVAATASGRDAVVRPTLPTGSGPKAGLLLKPGDRVSLRLPEPEPVNLVAEKVDFILLYEDQDVLVLAKPPGLVVHPAAGHRRGTLVHGLLHHCRDLSGISGQLRPGIVHRLDKDTSGCLVVAKNDMAHRELGRQFKAKEVEKIYQAMLWGAPRGEAGIVELPVGRHPVHRKKMAVRREGGREAVTHWRVLRRFTAGYTLVELRLETGRTHQIRVHMAALGCPLAGDQVYGRKGERDRLKGIERQWLHALHLAFHHPRDGRLLRFTAPLWPDLQSVLHSLEAEEQR